MSTNLAQSIRPAPRLRTWRPGGLKRSMPSTAPDALATQERSRISRQDGSARTITSSINWLNAQNGGPRPQ